MGRSKKPKDNKDKGKGNGQGQDKGSNLGKNNQSTSIANRNLTPETSSVRESESSNPENANDIPMERPSEDRGGGEFKHYDDKLLTNFFKVKFTKELECYQQAFEIKKEFVSNDANGLRTSIYKRVKCSRDKTMELICVEAAQNLGMPLATDGKSNVYSISPIPSSTITLGDLVVTLLQTPNPLRIQEADLSQEAVQALDILLRHDSVIGRDYQFRFRMVGKHLYELTEDDYALQQRQQLYNMRFCKGIYQSVRQVKAGLALNVERKGGAFFQEDMEVIRYLENYCRMNNPGTVAEWQKAIQSYLVGLKVRVEYNGRIFIVAGSSAVAADAISFNHRENPTRLLDYFANVKEHPVMTSRRLPCLNFSKNSAKPNYVPLEFCVVCKGQKIFVECLTGGDKEIVHNLCKVTADVRKAQTETIMGNTVRRVQNENALAMFKSIGMSISDRMETVNCKVLTVPHTELQEFHTKYSHFGVVCFGDNKDFVERKAKYVANRLIKELDGTGWWDGQPVVKLIADLENPTQLRSILQQEKKNGFKYVLCIIDNWQKQGHAMLKYIAEVEVGLLTQCCQASKIKEIPKATPYVKNVSLKINAKLGASNYKLDANVSLGKCMFIGADVNHPGGGDRHSHSAAAVVASMGINCWNTAYQATFRYQANGQEIINPAVMRDMVSELLRGYETINKDLPETIVFFRDGVSDPQFNEVLSRETKGLKDSVDDIYNEHSKPLPKLTVIVAKKRHNTRFFKVVTDNRTRRQQIVNPDKGSVIDTHIVHQRNFDFYLCSHKSFIGTLKPAHYTVLLDENGLSIAQVEKMAYDLCHTYSKCETALSLVPPIRYADLAAMRARVYYISAGKLVGRQRFEPEKIRVHNDVKSFMYFI